ncbi:unnamed protein product [Mytilus edulis]|uniref:Fucolectin tachylectin-4 pentraxin-1 domain-containing protein n=1 Tax=Mytilus edulis TaxID=6550 RepID=A0A8S3UIM4_MYTED|nr:unnamed protein product [Mytilus edulis]
MKITNYLITFLSFLVQSFAFRENIALNKNTIQSSTYLFWSNYKPAYASYAVDGNREQFENDPVGGPFCASTLSNEANYWWAIDLGQEYTINMITLYNREDCCDYRLTDFQLFIYNPSINTWTYYDQQQGQLCFYQAVAAPSVLTIACNQLIRGRFIKLYKKHHYFPLRDALTLCEVEVFADQTPYKGLYCKQTNKQPILSLQKILTKTTRLRCAIFCRKTDSCLGFTMTVDGTCSLFQTSKYSAGSHVGSIYFERC